MDIQQLETIRAVGGNPILAGNWNILLDACIEAVSVAQSGNETLDEVIRKVNNLETYRNKFDVLWEGNAYAAGTNLVLSAPSANYDILLVQITLQGGQYRFMNFEDGGLKSFREINLADSASSTAINMYEVNVRKINETTLQIASNKQQNLASGGTSWQTPTMDVTAQCITKIWGVKF